MQIANLLSKMENQWFVGREADIKVMTEVSLTNPSWSLLHLYGSAGIGKTTLLKRFQTIHTESEIIYLSGMEGYHTKESFLSDLWEEIHSFRNKSAIPTDIEINEANLANILNKISDESERIVLLLDSFELWTPIHKWFREKWIPLLSLGVRIITSSRFPLPADWLRSPGWISLIQSIEIGCLKKQTVQEYLNLRGITDKESRYYIEFYAKGVPLALHVICDIVELNGGIFCENNDAFRQFLYSLSRQLLSASNEIIHHQEMLIAGSLFWWFDYELLTSIYEQELSPAQFHQFCQLPYIELSENGCWRVNDAIRQWLNTDLSVRSPEKYESLLKRATIALKKKLEILPAEQKLPYVLNTLHVNQNGYVKRFGFGASNRQFIPGPVSKKDIPILMDMFRSFVVSLKPFLPDQWQQEQYFQEVWQTEPDSFIGVRYHNKIVGFLTFVPLNEQTRPLFLKNPVYQEYIKRSTLQKKEYLIWVISADPQHDPDVTSFILRYIFSNLAEDTLINVVSPFPDLAELFRSLGFQQFDWYNKKYTNQSPMAFLQLDLRNSDLSRAITRSLEPAKAESNRGMTEMCKLLKKLLISYHKAESEEITAAILGDFPALADKTKLNGLRKQISIAIEKMEHGAEDDQTLAAILTHAYLKKTANHETIAARLNLSLSTYYRYLKRAIERLAYMLLE